MKNNRSLLVIAVSAALLFAFQNCAKNAQVYVKPLSLKTTANVTYELPLTEDEIDEITSIDPGGDVAGNPDTSTSSSTSTSTGTQTQTGTEVGVNPDPIYNGCNFRTILANASLDASDGRVRIFHSSETIQINSFTGNEILLLGQGENIVVNIEGVIDRPISICGLKVSQVALQSCSFLWNLNQATTTVEKILTDDQSSECDSKAIHRQALTTVDVQTATQSMTGTAIETATVTATETSTVVETQTETYSTTQTSTATESDDGSSVVESQPTLVETIVDRVVNNPFVQFIMSLF